ncbi:MAG: SpoIIE family protein phosphatase [Bacteroidales bacterium]|nr:SpoIIE family protein phosphatase [Bacteroidales bacterium]
MKRLIIIAGVFICLSLFSYTQDAVKVYRKGLPFLKNYSPDETGAGSQNWAVIMDNRGVMYFGNGENGVIEFDGVNWRNIPISNNSMVLSLGVDDYGTVYVGAIAEIGYLRPDNLGKLQYNSLINKIDTASRNFNNVLKTFLFKDHIYFCTVHRIFKYSPDTDSLTVINMNDFGFKHGIRSFSVNGRIYHGDYGAGLLELDADTLRVVKGGDYFHVHAIMGMIPGEDNKIWIGSYKKGIVLYDPETGNIEENIISADVNNYIKEKALSQVISMGNGKLGLATLFGGFLIIDKEGQIIQEFDKSNGLQDETVYSSYVNPSQPSQSPLWLTLDIGIAKLEINSPLTKFSESSGFKNNINDIIQYKEKIFICTISGVYYIEGEKLVSFKKVRNINTSAWSFLKFDAGGTIPERLLVGSSEGLFDISGIEKGILIDQNVVGIKPQGRKYFIFELAGSSTNGNKIYLGTNDGLIILEYENGTWYQAYQKIFNQEIRSVFEDNNSRLWLGTSLNGIKMMDFSNQVDTVIITFTSEDGLPRNDRNYISKLRDKLYFVTSAGLYSFNETEEKFEPDSTFGNRYSSGEMGIFRMIKAANGDLWFSLQNENSKWVEVMKKNPDGTYEQDPSLKRLPNKSIDAIYDDDKGNVWMGVSNELYKYDRNFKKDFSIPYNTIIRQVNISEDSVVFYGTNYSTTENGRLRVDLSQPEELAQEINYKYNNFTFQWAALFFEQEEATLYRYWLEGYSDEWTRWNEKTDFTFTNLRQGHYIFHVQALNVFGIESTSALYTFTILPPWYQTVLAYIGYIIIAIIIIIVIVNLYTRRLRNENIRLEGIILERTAEIRKQKEELEDSILYARRIQRAMLPSKNILEENFPSHFILFKPRDVVSGDFYWMAKREGKVFIVAADCTGHGVPGAFMSLLGISFLNEIISKPKIEKSNEMLDDLREYVMTSLKQTGEGEDETKDGMDLSLIILDKQNKTVQFSGAYNPLYLVRELTSDEKTKLKNYDELDLSKGSLNNDDYILEQVNADKMPIGISVKKFDHFSRQEIDLESGLSLYMLSDGYVDQFGGPLGKKYMSRRFKKLILDIQDKSMEEQGKILDETLVEWIGDLDQIDDILVIGLKME